MEQRIKWLIKQMVDRRLTPSEEEDLATLLRTGEYDAILTAAIEDSLTLEEDPAFDPVAIQQRVEHILALDKTQRTLQQDPPLRRIPAIRKWWRYAAAALVITGTAIWFMHRSSHDSERKGSGPQAIAESFSNVRPGGSKALLTLDDGSTIILDSAGEGILSQQGRSDVVKVSGGVLTYRAAKEAPGAGKVYYNTVTTPKGGQYEVLLPDGSKVWLNAASSLRFPTAFAGTSREVYVTGEAYFEIATDAARPFYAKFNGLDVEVLGTSFNVNAYNDERMMKTTLLDGRIRVRTGQTSAILHPGQQAEVPVTGIPNPDTKKAGQIKLIDDANTEAAVAWKNGVFYLDNTDLASLLRQIGRWYNIDVVFEGPAPSGHITGKVPRDTELPKILRLLKNSGVHFRTEENKIIITR